MAVQKHNAYYSDEKGKIYYYDKNGNCKDVPPEGFAELERDIIYLSGAISGLPGQVQSDWAEDDASDPSYIKNKPEGLSLSAGDGIGIVEDAGNITVSVTGDYADRDKVEGEIEYLSGAIDNIPQKQSDWEETDTSDPAYILNKPDLSEKLDVSAFDDTIEQINDAFDEVDRRIDEIGSPLVWIDALSAAEINELSGVKNGWVYTLADDGTITGDDYSIDVRSGDEIAWTSAKNCWQPIGVTKPDNSWKQWSEDNGSTGVSGSVYIGKNNSADAIGINIGAENKIVTGDATLGASINIGKNNVNNYGILIGQRNESQGYSYVIGDDNKNSYYGDMIFGFNNGPSNTSCSRMIFGSNNSGYINDSIIVGRNISGSNINGDAILLGSNFYAYVQGGSTVIAQNGSNAPDYDINNNRVALTAENDANIFGGYTISDKQKAYKNPGIKSLYNSTIVGQGQNITAESDSYVFGNQSLAKYGSTVLGRHGYATSDSMVINWPTIDYSVPSTAHLENTLDVLLPTGTYYKVVDGNHVEKQIVGGDNTYRYHLVQNHGKHAMMVLNCTRIDGKSVRGSWNAAGDTFTEGTGWSYAYKLTGTINNDALLIEYDNGTVTTATKAQLGSSFPIYYDTSYYINDLRTHRLYTDGRYVYRSTSGNNVIADNDVTIPAFFVDPDFADKPANENFIYDTNVNQLGYTTAATGNTYNFASYDTDILPSAVLNQEQMITLSKAEYGSFALGPRNYANGGSITINVADQYVNTNYNSNPTHNITYNSDGSVNTINDITNKAEYGSIVIGLGSYYNTGTIIPNTGNYAYGGSFVLGTNNSAYGGSFVIGGNAYAEYDSMSLGMKGSRNDARYRSIVIGENDKANIHSYVLGFNSTAANLACTVGYQNNASGNAFVFGYNSEASGNACSFGQNSKAYGQSTSVGWMTTADNKSVTFGHNQSATRNSIALGMKGGLNIADRFSFAAGFSNTADQAAWTIGFKNLASGFAWSFGFDNYQRGMGMLLGFKNGDYYGDGSYWDPDNPQSRNEHVDMFGRWNTVASYMPPAGDHSSNYEATLIGNNNKIIVTTADWIGNGHEGDGYYSFNGIFLGKDNECYMDCPGGYNIYLGLRNKGAYESINIGTSNETNGHGIALGWYNKGFKGGNATHSIMLGYSNSADTDRTLLSAKNIPYIIQTSLTPSQKQEKISEIEVVSAEYEAADTSANEATMHWLNMLVAGGIDSYSARKYINGVIYDNAYWNSTVPYRMSGYQYRWYSAGNWHYGTGESAFINYLNYEYRNYSTKPAYIQAAIDIWSAASAIYIAQSGSNSAEIYSNIADPLDISIEKKRQWDVLENDLNYEHSGVSSSGTASASPETNNFIVGTTNSANHYNSILIGSNNHSLYPISNNNTNDDGFVVAVGLGNTVGRNYDMAIGYGVLASGGENIAIGAPITNEYGYVRYNTKALGYKNISVRSNVAGIGNIAVDTLISGDIAETFDGSNNREYDGIINDNNQYFNSTLLFNQPGYHANISKNVIENANFNADVNRYFVYNNISDLVDGIFSGSLTHNDFIHNKNLILKTNYTSDGIEENMFLHTTNISANVDEMSHNIFSHVWGNLNSNQSHNNLLFNTNIDVSANMNGYRGFSNNFAQNSMVTGIVEGIGDCFFFDSTATYNTNSWGCNNSDVMFFSRYINDFTGQPLPSNGIINASVGQGAGQNFLFGTFGINLHSVFSFSDRQGLNYPEPGYGVSEPFIVNGCRIYNFGDNMFVNAANIDCAGERNQVSAIKCASIHGNSNYVMTENDGDNSDFISIYGQANNYIVSGYTTDVNYFTIIGNNNDAEAAKEAGRNIILGSCNSYHSVSASAFSGMDNLVNVYSAIVDNINYNYNIGTYVDDNYRIVGAPIHYSNRNTIIGQHSVISDGINDSVIVGSNNLIYNTAYETMGSSFRNKNSISNNFALGSYNLLKDGSNQVNIGVAGVTSGHNAMSFGEGLIANTSQVVVGRMNEELPGTNGLSATGVDSTSGALFIVGNGRHVAGSYAAADVERSNAMIVSADGTVSATKFATSNIADLESVITGIQSDIGDIETALNAIINGSN